MTATTRGDATTAVGSTEDARKGADALRLLGTLRRLALTTLFVGGIVGGIQLYSLLNPPLDYGTLPPLREAAEPIAAGELADLVEAGDETRLAGRYQPDLLEAISQALTVGAGGGLQPLLEVREIRYLGSVSDGLDTLALYVALGRLDGGVDAAAGFSVRVRDGEVIGVN